MQGLIDSSPSELAKFAHVRQVVLVRVQAFADAFARCPKVQTRNLVMSSGNHVNSLKKQTKGGDSSSPQHFPHAPRRNRSF
ncbi:hypothetical protein EWB00_010587 [Schistosoma japonicum]|uniref:Uncharacterized protein n=1 Tax=Schistosoma japonicum TaxID=6182 RepID=A0A4Z2DNT3_SCHJA|nr:hypothetical protein EWB00_010587 [Schistosoma japonicum]